VGNILTDEVGPALDDYDFHGRYTVGNNTKCGACGLNSRCGKGCPAAIISRGGVIGDVDTEQCPVPDGPRLLQIGRRLT
jgi:radical SAM protein with 4Fe4S-binding SPASM domain